MKIIIETILHSQQRYPTVGDWYNDGEVLHIKVSQMTDWRYELLVAVHELIEVSLCKHRGVDEKSVDTFDMAYEKNRKEGDVSEPGDDPTAPYQNEHCFATGVERLLAAALDVAWGPYDKEVSEL